MSVFLEKFILPTVEQEEDIIKRRMSYNGGAFGYIDNAYPCGLFSRKMFTELDFENVTILYGGNGSGKSTLLNVISNATNLIRFAPFNSGEVFDDYVSHCKCRMGYKDIGSFYKSIPPQSSIFTSDNIFDYMLTLRESNGQIAAQTKEWHDELYGELKYGKKTPFSMDNLEQFKLQRATRNKSISRRQFIYNLVGKETPHQSNGETALRFFDVNLKNNCLYCLDEPENSLSPKFQRKLVDLLVDKVYCGCQLIIATHSPFILALPNAKIYDLDACPADIKKWYELENVKEYFDFFYQNKQLFGK